MVKIKEYPKGYPLFELIKSADLPAKEMKGIPWEVDIFYDPCYQPLSIKTALKHEASLTMRFAGTANGAKAIYTMDSGASASFIDRTYAWDNGFKTSGTHKVVTLADGSDVISHEICTIHIKMHASERGQIYTKKQSCYVIDLGQAFQVLLGEDWLMSERADLSYNSNACTIHSGDRTMKFMPIQCQDRSLQSSHPLINAVQLRRLTRKGLTCFVVNIIDSGVHLSPTPEHDTSHENHEMDTINVPMEIPNDLSVHMKETLQKHKTVFQIRKGLPPDRGISHVIPLIPGSVPAYRPPYRHSPAELKEIESKVKEFLLQGIIEPSTSPYGANVVFVRKKDNTLRMCIDWRLLNSRTIPNRSSIPNIQQLLDQVHGAKLISSLDLCGAYHQIRISEEDKIKTAFHTPYGSYQFKVLVEGLMNAPSCFQSCLTHMFQKHEYAHTPHSRDNKANSNDSGTCKQSRIKLGKTVLIYLDDILCMTHSDDTAEHASLVSEVLQLLEDNAFYVKYKKCLWERKTLRYLGHIVGNNEIRVDPAKIEAVVNWPVPKNVSQLRSFNGLTCYFRKHVKAYAQMIAPLTHLTRTDVPWNWGADCQQAFDEIKRALTTAPVLTLPDYTDPTGFEVLCDASIHGIGSVLTQHGKPIAYESKKLSAAEVNWTTGDQEAWAVVHALKTFRPYLEGIPFLVVTDHCPLTHLKTQPSLSRRQARWMEYLARFDFEWRYRPGRDNVADPLSRHPNFTVAILALVTTRSMKKGNDNMVRTDKKRKRVSFANPVAQVIPHNPFHTTAPQDDLYKHITKGYTDDKWFSDSKNTESLTFKDDLWWEGERVVIPDVTTIKRSIMFEMHDTPYSGHMGVRKTLHAIQRVFWWPYMRQEITKYVNECISCQKNKLGFGQKSAGLLQPLPIPEFPWQSVSLDFITHLPRSQRGNDAILTMVDRMTKMTHLAPCKTTIDSEGTAQLFLNHVWKIHGLPENIVSDRGSVFVGKFFSELLRLIGTKHNRSTAFHPQSDGACERQNKILEDCLRHYVGCSNHGCWEKYLATAEFAINNAFQESIGTTPFRLNAGRDPRTPISAPHAAVQVPAAATFADRMAEGLNQAKKCFEAAQQRQKRYADTKRRDVSFAEGDMVLLSTRNIAMRVSGDRTTTPKLFPKFIGPYRIEKRVGQVAYKLTLPEGMRIHPVFHVSLLKLYREERGMQPPEPLVINDEALFLMEKILDHKIVQIGRKSYREYLIKWQGQAPDHNSWVPESALINSASASLRTYWETMGYDPPPHLFPTTS